MYGTTELKTVWISAGMIDVPPVWTEAGSACRQVDPNLLNTAVKKEQNFHVKIHHLNGIFNGKYKYIYLNGFGMPIESISS